MLQVAVVCFILVQACAAYTPTTHGVLVPIGSYQVELAVQGMTAFRVSVSKSGAPVQIDSPFLETQTSYATFTITSQGDQVGLKSTFGSVVIDSKSTFSLLNAEGDILTTSTLLPSFQGKKDTCSNLHTNTDVSDGTRVPQYPDGVSGQTVDSCCALCNNNANCTVFVWADGSHPDPSGKNCWLLMNVDSFVQRTGRTSGGALIPPPSSVELTLGVRDGNTRFFGAGGGYSTVTSLTATSSNPHVSNTEFFVPHYWSTDGYAALGVTAELFNPKSVNAYEASWNAGSMVTWVMAGNQADLYLMPAPAMPDGLRVYWDLTGRPRVLPRYAYGFLASRWGWTNRDYIEQMLTDFRNGSFPIDAWISDFEVSAFVFLC
jgi:alpha-glucosidase (family GH31 glycosyl hydrolase)